MPRLSTLIADLPVPLPRVVHASKCLLAALYRPFLGGTCFVGVTGSCGKTTTKSLIAAVLMRRGRVRVRTTLTNPPHRVAGTVLRVRPGDKFCVQELGGFAPGVLKRATAVFRPHIGVVTNVGFDHYASFRGPDGAALEKRALVESLPSSGWAVLNADDPRVAAMRGLTGARVITYGLSSGADVHGSSVSSTWPATLSLEAEAAGERVRIRTRLYGEHWASAVLAALGAGLAVGIPLSEAAAAIEIVDPVEGRMRPVRSADGVTFLVDTWKAPRWTIPAAVRFMAAARAGRKVMVLGHISDYPGSASACYRKSAREALAACDLVVFVGSNAHCAAREGKAGGRARLEVFDSFEKAAGFLRRELRPGDLVLLKGSRVDHLERLALDAIESLRCWKNTCGEWRMCDHCPDRAEPSRGIPAGGKAEAEAEDPLPGQGRRKGEGPC